MPNRVLRAAHAVPVLILALAVAILCGDRRASASPQAGSAKAAFEGAPVPTVTLRLRETTVFSSPAPNAFAAGDRCDSNGDVFVRLGFFDPTRPGVQIDPAVSEIIPESKRIATYGSSPLSSSDYPNSSSRSFNVTPGGAVYALITTRAKPSSESPSPVREYYVERFKDDGTTDSITHVEPPPDATRWSPNLLGVFRDGSLLIAGTLSGSANPGAISRRPFTAIYDPSGRFVREVTLPDDVVNELANDNGSVQQGPKNGEAPTPAGKVGAALGAGDKVQSAADAQAQAVPTEPPKARESFDLSIATGDMVSGPDGNLWILRASDPLRLYAVSSAGEVVRHFQFPVPASGLKPFQFGFAGPEQIFFEFAHFAGSSGAASGSTNALAVFNALSERFETLYTLPDTEKGFRALACSDGRGGFLYLGGTSDNHLAVYDYGPR